MRSNQWEDCFNQVKTCLDETSMELTGQPTKAMVFPTNKPFDSSQKQTEGMVLANNTLVIGSRQPIVCTIQATISKGTPTIQLMVSSKELNVRFNHPVTCIDEATDELVGWILQQPVR